MSKLGILILWVVFPVLMNLCNSLTRQDVGQNFVEDGVARVEEDVAEEGWARDGSGGSAVAVELISLLV